MPYQTETSLPLDRPANGGNRNDYSAGSVRKHSEDPHIFRFLADDLGLGPKGNFDTIRDVFDLLAGKYAGLPGSKTFHAATRWLAASLGIGHKAARNALDLLIKVKALVVVGYANPRRQLDKNGNPCVPPLKLRWASALRSLFADGRRRFAPSEWQQKGAQARAEKRGHKGEPKKGGTLPPSLTGKGGGQPVSAGGCPTPVQTIEKNRRPPGTGFAGSVQRPAAPPWAVREYAGPKAPPPSKVLCVVEESNPDLERGLAGLWAALAARKERGCR